MPMRRRSFLQALSTASASWVLPDYCLADPNDRSQGDIQADLIIAGGGLGGCAAALAALRNGLTVVLTEETDWLGGQLTQQAVPPDEHPWIESHGCTQSYRSLRDGIRDYYRRHFPLTPVARDSIQLNPGNGLVSRLCHEPRVALAVLESMLARFRSGRRLTVLREHQVIAANTEGDLVRQLKVRNLRDGREFVLDAPWFLDATELGDLLPLTGTEFVTGSESRRDTGELHSREEADPANQQAVTQCFAVDYLEGENHVIDRPEDYAFWKEYVPNLNPPWPGRLLDWTYTQPSTTQPKELGFAPVGESKPGTMNLWRYRRIADRAHFEPGTYQSDISLINWPQNDYFLGNLVGVETDDATRHRHEAKQLSLSLLYWLQTEAPRADGGTGFGGLRLRPDVVGTVDGLAKYPYIREARRIQAVFTVLEKHCGRANRAQETGQRESEVRAAEFWDTVGIGSYHIDLHPSTRGDNYIDFASLPFQIPLGALLPRRIRNLLPAAKNIGTTHITNGCYRLHPVEWNIGEAAGALIAFCWQRKTWPHAVREDNQQITEFQEMLCRQGVELEWPKA
ncbi:MAG: FAD-dependent oxidoreductase [Pirellulales bacterium]|nr:FAD-dependent oxidoreductase [Pirellulales bacterium]